MNSAVSSLTTITAISRDVLREARSSKMLLVLFTLIGLFLLGLVLTFNLDVVDGALAGSRMMAKQGGTAPETIDSSMREAFGFVAKVTFYTGLLFGIVATADITPKALQPGRVEHLLALPVRRTELVIGLYLGVCAICAVMTSVTVGGISLVLFIKAEVFTLAPLVGGAVAFIGFAAVYAVMLAVGAIARSAALSAGAGLFIYMIGIFVVGTREKWIVLLDSPTRQILDVVTMPIPNLEALAEIGASAAMGKAQTFAATAPVIGTTLMFAVVGVAIASAVVSSRDY